MIDQELFEDYKQNPTIEKRNALVEQNHYMVDILAKVWNMTIYIRLEHLLW